MEVTNLYFPEAGQIALIIAFVLAVLQIVLPLLGVQTRQVSLMNYARPLAVGQAVFLLLSLIALTLSFVYDDFSVAYVATNSNTALPTPYKISAVWGAHEGSLLLWVTMLGLWGAAVAIFSRSLPLDMIARVIAVLGMVSVGFILFTLMTSNPFERLLPSPPLEGSDLNPLLQDFGLIVHPPTLYMGYVGLSVAFAFAIAALMGGRLDAAWARWSRPWTTAAWVFLTIGIALGSWWAYYELGWGGWWFWDPVENASLMPWFVATALLHSLAVTEKRGLFKSWTVLLAIFAFSLSLLGTFLVRSGVLTSVHSFASDPERGMFILALLGICVGGSLLLFAFKAPTVGTYGRYDWISREMFLLFNNLLLVVLALAVLTGTLYPLLYDFMGYGKLSVGAAWFNKVFIPLALGLAVLMGFGAMTRWKSDSAKRLSKELGIFALFSLVFAIVFAVITPKILAGSLEASVVLGLAIAFWLTLATLADLWKKARGRLARIPKLGLSYLGMIVAHLGVAISIVGVTMVANFSIEKSIRMEPGQSFEAAGYVFKFEESGRLVGPNYMSDATRFKIYKHDELVTELVPEKRRYNASGQIMTEAAIHASLFRDLYVSMGEPLEGGAWGMRIQVKAFMRWVWLGAIFMSVGGLMAIMDKRYRKRSPNKRKPTPSSSTDAAEA